MMPDATTPLTEVTFAFVDVETTGLDPASGHRLCEIALLRTRDGRVLDTFNTLVNPQRQVEADAFAVHGIGPEALATAPIFAEVADDVARRLDGVVLVAHNAPFDLGFLAAEWRRLRWPPWQGPVVDTLALARARFRFGSNGLGSVAQALGIPPMRSHRALADAETTFHVLHTMLKHLRARTLGDVLQAQFGTVRWPDAARNRREDLPLPLAIALSERRRLWLRYCDTNGQTSERWVDVLDVQNACLVAYCHLRQAERHFRLDRIIEMRLERE